MRTHTITRGILLALCTAIAVFAGMQLFGCSVDAPDTATIGEAANLEAQADCRRAVACDAIAGSYEPTCVVNMTKAILQPCAKSDNGQTTCTTLDESAPFPGDLAAFESCVATYEDAACDGTAYAPAACWP
jgi:molybdopterin-guanine dinucleotide biosynthesis protein A